MIRLVVAVSILTASAVSASAADLPAAYSKAPPVARAYNWSGCYIGAEAGGAWGRSGIEAVTVIGNAPPAAPGLPFTNDFSLSGALVGGTTGCNYQTGNWVFGTEGDVSWTDKSGAANNIAPFNQADSNLLREHWFDTVRGRIGYARDRLLIYGPPAPPSRAQTCNFLITASLVAA
jgi:outer membrane immunogenic protein